MPHDAEARRQAAAVPLVLFGEHGRTVEGYMPATEDLAAADASRFVGSRYQPVAGPFLRRGHTKDRRSKTGLVGISFSTERATGRTFVRVRLGGTCRRFCVETLGRDEALRRAIALRKQHLEKLALANAAIIGARLQAAKRGAA